MSSKVEMNSEKSLRRRDRSIMNICIIRSTVHCSIATEMAFNGEGNVTRFYTLTSLVASY
ncbi:hypothetical protein C0J52_06864 [Blattella germanica]|nr:hypothetical protein C0J52_06864 [Blattella germanica]